MYLKESLGFRPSSWRGMQAKMGFERKISVSKHKKEKITEHVQLIESLSWLKHRDGVEDREKGAVVHWSWTVDRMPTC